jgi:hypothetical protein
MGYSLFCSIGIRSSRLNGAFSIDGQTCNAAQACGGFYELVQPSSAQDSINMGYFFDQTYDLNVINSVNYHNQSGQQTSLNYQETITDIDVQADSVFNIVLPQIEVTPAFALNASPFPQSTPERADFYLQSANSDELIFPSYSNTSNYPAGMIPATCSVINQYQSDSPLYTKICPHKISQQDPVLLSDTQQASGTVIVPPENHQLFDSIRERSGQLPLPANNHFVFLNNLAITSDISIDHNLESTEITLYLTLNGYAFPNSAYEYTRRYLASNENEQIFVMDIFGLASYGRQIH